MTSGVIGVSMMVSACSGGGSSDSTCALDSSGGDGAASWSFDGDPACVIPYGGPVGIDMYFAPLSGDPKHVVVRVADVMAGQLGTFPAAFEVELRSGATFKTTRTCTITITEHTDAGESDAFSRTFQTAGHGECAELATEVGGSATDTIDPFDFRFPAHWPAP